MTVLPQNDNVPVFLSASNPTVNENQALVQTLLATDADLPAQSINFSIAGTGADDALFTVNASHQLVFTVPPDFESPSDANGDNVYQVNVRANDGNGGVATQSISVTVLPQNDNVPVFLSASNPTVNENQALVLTLLATDADLPAQLISFSIAGTGADDALFTVNASHQLVFIVPPDFESPSDANGDNVYQVNVRANDGNGGVATQSISVTVLPQNDNVPVFLSASNPTVNENQALVLTLLATDADLPAQSINFSIAGTGADDALFTVNALHQLVFTVPPDFESPSDANGDNVYQVEVQASDANGSWTVQSLSVTVVNRNEPPVVTASIFGIPENATAGTVVGTISSSDPDAGQSLTYTIIGGTGATVFSMGASTGTITVLDPLQLDFESVTSFSIVIQVSDNGTPTLNRVTTVAVNVFDVNEAPVFVSSNNWIIVENTTDVATITATDVEGDALSYSLVGGADMSRLVGGTPSPGNCVCWRQPILNNRMTRRLTVRMRFACAWMTVAAEVLSNC